MATIILSCYVNNAILPVTVSFLNALDGFNPLHIVSSHPLFNTLSFSYGSNTNPLPTGTYTIKFTDFCGHTVMRNIDITNAPPFELFSIDQSTCFRNDKDINGKPCCYHSCCTYRGPGKL